MMKHFYLLLFVIGGLLTKTTDAQSFTFTPPGNFISGPLNDGENTWFNKSAGSVIQISTTEGTSFSAFSDSFNEKQLTDNNLVIKEKRNFAPDKDSGHTALVFICSFRTTAADASRDVEFTRIIYFTGTEKTVIMAVATIPAMAEPVLLEPIIQSFGKDLLVY